MYIPRARKSAKFPVLVVGGDGDHRDNGSSECDDSSYGDDNGWMCNVWRQIKY